MEEVPVPPQPKWTKVVIVVQIEYVLAPEGVVDKGAVAALHKCLARLKSANVEVHVVFYASVWKDKGKLDSACEAVDPGSERAKSVIFVKREEDGPLMEDLVRRELEKRMDHGYAIVCSEIEKFAPVGLVDNVASIGKGDVFGEKHIDDVIEKARIGSRVFRAYEIDHAAHRSRMQLIETAWSIMHGANNALSLLGCAGKNQDIKSDYEIYRDDVTVQHCQTFYKEQIKKLAEINAQMDRIFKDAFESERKRIQEAYDADAQKAAEEKK